MRRAVYAFIVIIILAFVGGFPAYLAIGQGGNQNATVTVTARPAYSSPAGGGGFPGEAGCPAGEVSTAGRATGAGTVTQSFVIKSFDKRFSLFLDEGIVVLTPKGTCPRCIGIHEMTTLPSLPEGARLVGTMYDVVPDSVTFAPPATIRYSYDPVAIPEGISEGSLVIACCESATGEWINLGGVVDTEANTITAKVSQIYDLAVLGYEAEAPAPTPTPTPTPPPTPTPTPTPSPTPVPTPPTPPTPTPINWWLIGGIIAAVMVLAFLGYRFRKKLSPLSQRLSPLLQRKWGRIKRMKNILGLV